MTTRTRALLGLLLGSLVSATAHADGVSVAPTFKSPRLKDAGVKKVIAAGVKAHVWEGASIDCEANGEDVGCYVRLAAASRFTRQPLETQGQLTIGLCELFAATYENVTGCNVTFGGASNVIGEFGWDAEGTHPTVTWRPWYLRDHAGRK